MNRHPLISARLVALAVLAAALAGCGSWSARNASPTNPDERSITDEENAGGVPPAKGDLQSLAAEFRTLRAQTSHYKPGGEFNHNVDPYGSQMHRVMEALHIRLNNDKPTIESLTALLGEPDAKETREGLLVLLYYWRGRHDYLYFVTDGTKVTAIRWYFAYE